MKTMSLEQSIRRLAEAGEQNHHPSCRSQWGYSCNCGAVKRNAAVDAALAEALAELKLLESNLPKWDCAICHRAECPHSGRFPQRPGPKDGCSSFKGGI